MLLKVLCVAFALVSSVRCNREKKINEILDTVKRLEDHIAKEDRIREIADIVRIDQNVDKLNAKIDRILNILDSSGPPSAIGRSDVIRTVGLESIQSRLEGLETAVTGMESSMRKLDFDPMTVNEIEKRTTQLKDEMNIKLRKIMNVVTSLYELNKNMNSQQIHQDQPTPGGSSKSADFANEFLMENLEELERKIKEQFSVLASEIRSEVNGLKMVTSSVCQGSEKNSEDDEDWLTKARSGRIPIGQEGRSLGSETSGLDNLVESLSRSTRQIREEIQQGIQDIDSRLQNLTTYRCDNLDMASSVLSSRSVPPPEQSLQSRSGRKSKDEPVFCTRTALNTPSPKSCADHRRGGATCDGVYVIFPKGKRAVRVYCDMTTDGGGWTLILRRGDYGDKMTSFHRNWLSYKNGFGDVDGGEFYLGNDVTHLLTSEETSMLRVHLSAYDGDEINLDYTTFAIGEEEDNYVLQLGPSLVGNQAANSLRYHNNHPFSTYDRKNDNFDQNCAATYKGGWWFNGCYFGFLTGEFFRPEERRENWQGMLWYDWKGNQALKAAEMMIRPKNFATQ